MPLFWILFLFLFYTIVGFLLVPPFAKSKIVKTINNKFGQKAHIENVSFNPFSFSFSISGFVLTDSKRGEILSTNEIYVNLNAIPLLHKQIDIETLEINDSELYLEKLKEKFNFSRLFTSKDSTEHSSGWDIFINEFNAQNLNIALQNKPTEPLERTIFENITIHLKDVIPQSNISSRVELNVTSTDEHEYKFTGLFSNMLLQIELSSLQDTLIINKTN